MLDARDFDDEPFGDGMVELGVLERSETFLLIGSFEPAPRYTVPEQRGFAYETTAPDTDRRNVRIEHA